MFLSRAVKVPAIKEKLNCFEVSPRTAMSRLFQEVLFQRCVETGMKPEKVNMRISTTKKMVIEHGLEVFLLFYSILFI